MKFYSSLRFFVSILFLHPIWLGLRLAAVTHCPNRRKLTFKTPFQSFAVYKGCKVSPELVLFQSSQVLETNAIAVFFPHPPR